jgi:hypothetical protein
MPTPLPSVELEARIKELVRVYRTARENIYARLREGALTSFQEFRLQEHKKQINTIIRELDKAAVQVAEGIIPPMYEHGADIAAVALRDQGKRVGNLNMGNRIHTRAVQALTEQMAQDLLFANSGILQQATRILRKTQQAAINDRQINQLIAQGLAQGETRTEVSERLTAALRKKVGLDDGIRITVRGEKSVRHFTPEYYAELVARTQTREASTEGALRFGQERGYSLYRISTHEGACPMCQVYQGKIYSVTPHPDFPELDARPPFHPNCTHIMTPVDPDTLKERGEYDALSALSNDKGSFVHGSRDYDAILEGAKPSREAKDWGEKSATRKRRTKSADVTLG